MHAVDHLRHGLADDRQAGRRRIGHADPRPQQAHVVVDLGHRADRRARVARGRLLLDRDRRRQALDQIDIGLLHQLEELPGIGRQALDIAALALGIDRVEGERRLARARQAGDHHQAVARQVDVDVLEIVLARAADGDEAMRLGDGGAGFCHWTGRIARCAGPPHMAINPQPCQTRRQAVAACSACMRAVGRSFISSCMVPATRPIEHADLPGEVVGAHQIKEIAAAPGAEEGAGLMAEEGDAGQGREEAQAEELHDQPVDQRDDAQPERAHGGAEQHHR